MSLRASDHQLGEWRNPFTLKFPTPGVYGLTLIFRMTGPPDHGPEVDVRTEKFRVDVRVPGDKCKPAAGSAAENFPTVAQTLAGPQTPRGTIRCQPGGGFTAGPETLSPGNTTISIIDNIDEVAGLSALPADEKLDLAFQLQDMYEGCVLEHERDHVRFLSDPVNGLDHLCDNSCCDRTPIVLSDAKRYCSEKKAYEVSRDCFEKRKNATADPNERKVLQKAEMDANKGVSDNINKVAKLGVTCP